MDGKNNIVFKFKNLLISIIMGLKGFFLAIIYSSLIFIFKIYTENSRMIRRKKDIEINRKEDI
ncbi:hypothetical protein CLVI_05290 [Clostridium vincentii]|uniref:Uncharacterized protein n=1 Tax=Clostridium vincentii TaxID=52704 RepID=A0A2T0BJ03_9CLOT|nr:hypothetical protein CLVI_05290 [Clostridium vincentii]